jgi:hypothetical protein
LLFDPLSLKRKRRAELDLAAPSRERWRQEASLVRFLSLAHGSLLPIVRVRPVGRIRGRNEVVVVVVVVGGGDPVAGPGIDRDAFGTTGQLEYSSHARPGPSLCTSDLIG